MLANTIFIVQKPIIIMNNRLDTETSVLSASIASSPEFMSDTFRFATNELMRSDAKVCCNDTQNEYNLCGTTVMRLQAKKPFNALRHVPFMLA